MKVRAIVTGSTGMVGEGVLLECLSHPDVEQVLVINRKSCGYTHPKLKEIIHADFFDLSPIQDQLVNYNACFFCLGVSSIGMKEPEYRHLTYDLTMNMAQLLCKQNPGMVFTYVSGAGTNNKGTSRSFWVRVKGKTETDLMALPFKKAYMFRPGFMKATEGSKNPPKVYYAFSWLYPVLRMLIPKFVCTLKEVGIAMIHCVTIGYDKQILEVTDIVKLAGK
jgi:hypothetical protein